MKVAGFDIGGANTDLAIVEYENGEIKDIQTVFEYLPMWSQNERLGNVLYDLIEKICPVDEIDAVGISMTAELVDAFETKILQPLVKSSLTVLLHISVQIRYCHLLSLLQTLLKLQLQTGLPLHTLLLKLKRIAFL